MTKRVKCCIPGCGNSYKNKGNLRFYRIPKDIDIRNSYRLILRDKSVRIDSDSTRICSAHFESGIKLSRSHLPNIFPWTSGEDQKVGEKRKNLENIASVLKTLKNRSPVPTGQDGVDGGIDYGFRRVPWRFDDLPLCNGRISGFKTNDELMAYTTPLNQPSMVAYQVIQDGNNAINFTQGQYPTETQDVRVKYEPTLHMETQLNQEDFSNSNNVINQLSVLDNNDLSDSDNPDMTVEKPKVKIYKECACQTEVSEDDFQLMAYNLNAVKSENRRLKQELETLKRSFCNI